MKYKNRRKYKYILEEDETVFCLYYPGVAGITVQLPYLSFNTTTEELIIKKGYTWDGPSGPTIDTDTFMRGSLVHDALYQLIREGYLPQGVKSWADRRLRKICLEDGMSRIRAAYVYRSVELFGHSSCNPEKHIKKAP